MNIFAYSLLVFRPLHVRMIWPLRRTLMELPPSAVNAI
jgi:hypothetical protein